MLISSLSSTRQSGYVNLLPARLDCKCSRTFEIPTQKKNSFQLLLNYYFAFLPVQIANFADPTPNATIHNHIFLMTPYDRGVLTYPLCSQVRQE